MEYILAIESSCDDTSASIIGNGEVLSNIVSSQIVHREYGGVIPELASREHLQKIIPVVSKALETANITKHQLSAIAVTRGPGLLGSLIVGVSFAKSLAQGLDVPLIEVQHMQAHIMANFAKGPSPSFPFICLTVSGGHTQLVRVDDFDKMTILGQTIDDAAGEAFDKTGKMLGLPYPSGPQIDKIAQTGEAKYIFPQSKVTGYNFSFSGFKTSVMYFLRDQVKSDENFINKELANLCASIQENICLTLIGKLEKAAKEENIKCIALAGGVSANSRLRDLFNDMCSRNEWQGHIPPISFCTDNAGMIALAAWQKFLKNEFSNLSMAPDPRLSF